MDRKIISIIIMVMVVSLFLYGCSKTVQEDTGDHMMEDDNMQAQEDVAPDVTGSISEVDNADSDLDVNELDSELSDLSNELENW